MFRWAGAQGIAAVAFCAIAACSSNNPGGNGKPTETGTEQPCNKDEDCSGGGACCSGQCEILSLSNNSCGACGVECSASQFCTGTACAAFNFQTLCADADVMVVHRGPKQIQGVTDNPQADNAASDSLATAFHTFCNGASPSASVATEDDVVSNNNSGPLSTGRGALIVVAGGRVYSSVMDYLDNVNVTPVELVTTETYFQLVARSERKVIVQDTINNLGDNLDYVVGQAIYDATSGTQIINAYGIMQSGTTAAVNYFASLVGQQGFGSTYWFVGKLQNGQVTRLDGQ